MRHALSERVQTGKDVQICLKWQLSVRRDTITTPLEGLAERNDIKLCAIAPGQPGGDITALKQRTAPFSPRIYANHGELLAAERPDIAVINPCSVTRPA